MDGGGGGGGSGLSDRPDDVRTAILGDPGRPARARPGSFWSGPGGPRRPGSALPHVGEDGVPSGCLPPACLGGDLARATGRARRPVCSLARRARRPTARWRQSRMAMTSCGRGARHPSSEAALGVPSMIDRCGGRGPGAAMTGRCPPRSRRSGQPCRCNPCRGTRPGWTFRYRPCTRRLRSRSVSFFGRRAQSTRAAWW